MRVLSLALLSALFLAAAVPAISAAQDGPAARFLKRKHDQAERLLRRAPQNDRDRARRTAQLDAILGDLLDYRAVSEQALDSTWGERSEAERAEFVTLLRQLVERSYQESLQRTLDYQIRWGDEVARGDAVLVTTTARSRRNRRAPEVTIEYRLKREGDRWVVVDVVTDGVSMVRNYRNQFSRILRRDGWDGLLGRMRTRLAEGS
jgi:phospholipid transport system substrate-binding protein